jgi:hypothetical protein
VEKWFHDSPTCLKCFNAYADQLHTLLTCPENLEQLIPMAQKIQITITQGRKLPTSGMHSDLRIPGTAIYMNPYQIYMPNKPVDPLKCYTIWLELCQANAYVIKTT